MLHDRHLDILSILQSFDIEIFARCFNHTAIIKTSIFSYYRQFLSITSPILYVLLFIGHNLLHRAADIRVGVSFNIIDLYFFSMSWLNLTEINLGLRICLSKVSISTHMESRIDSSLVGLKVLFNYSILTCIQTSSLWIIDGFQNCLLFICSIVEFNIKVIL